jgi:hypothetical protein
MSGAPNSRFMNELLVIWPTHPVGWASFFGFASWKNRSIKGTVIAYLRWQVSYRFR